MDLKQITWRKAGRSGENGGNCVEVGRLARMVAVRDSKDPDGPVLLVTGAALRTAVHEHLGVVPDHLCAAQERVTTA